MTTMQKAQSSSISSNQITTFSIKLFIAIALPVIAITVYSVFAGVGLSVVASIIGIGLITAFIANFVLSKSILTPLKLTTQYVNAMANGDFNVAIDTNNISNAGHILQALKSMQTKLNAVVSDAQIIARDGRSLEIGLNNSIVGVTFSNSDNNLQYINQAAKDIWQGMSSGVRRQHQDFSVNAMLGKRIGQFFENDEVRAVFAQQLTSPKVIEIYMYGYHLELMLIPVHNEEGEYLGRMTQWVNRTAEVAAEKEIARLVDGAVAGRLSERVNLSILTVGFIHDMGKGINALLDAVINPLNMSAGYVENFAKGIIPAKITDSYNGDFNIIKNNLNTCIDALTLLVSDTNMLVKAAQNNHLDARADATKHSGDYRKIVEGVNGTLDTVMQKNAANAAEKEQEAQILSDAVEETQAIIESAKAGDLSNRVPLDGKDGAIASLCDGINALMDKMTEIIVQVREAGETINTAAGEIAAGNNDLSSRTEQQASSLEETAASMEQLASTVKNNAENAKQANQLAISASGIAVRGGSVVSEVVSTMSAINTSSKKIEDIISVIDGIAFQTNILALNAAVEAARAGEQGRGFAVVAAEVRNLAQRSATAAKEIKELIHDSVSKTAEGTRQVETAGATMQEIVSSVQRVTDIMGEITAASVEQSQGIDQVNSAVTSMDEVTQQNAALVEEATAAAESLVEQAANLIDTVSAFRLIGSNQKNRHLRTIAPPAQLHGNAQLKLVSHSGDAKFSFEDAREAHTKWKNRLIDYIAGRSIEHLEVDKVCRDDQCPLGGWIYGQAKKYSHMPEYRELKTAHAEFHQGLGEIVRCVHNQNHAEAKKMLGGDFSKTSKRTIAAISNIEAKVK